MADENQAALGAEEHQTTEVVEIDSPQAPPDEETAETEVVPSEPSPEQGGGQTYDAPNQQAVGQPHPSEEGTGGQAGSLEQAAGTIEEEEPPSRPQRGRARRQQ